MIGPGTMGTIQPPPPVKLVCPTLAADERCFERAETLLQERFGPLDLTSPTWDFDYTDYYRNEMGAGLKRRIYSFRRLIDPAGLAEIKKFTNAGEQTITEDCNRASGRVINLDPGYISSGKLVLATTKDHAHRIYLGEGIFAEVTLVWRGDGFQPLDTTYPDYRTEGYRDFFALVRTLLMLFQKRT